MQKKYICTIIIAGVLILSCGIIAIRYFSAGDERIAYVYSDDILVKTIDLNTVVQPYSFSITSKNGGTNTIEV